MERVTAEHVALNANLQTMSADMQGIGTVRMSLAAAHAAQQPSATSKVAARIPLHPPSSDRIGAQTPRHPVFVPFGGTFTPSTPGAGALGASTLTLHSPAAVMIQGHTKQLHTPITPAMVRAFVQFARMEGGRWPTPAARAADKSRLPACRSRSASARCERSAELTLTSRWATRRLQTRRF
jgi:hypothetical protein